MSGGLGSKICPCDFPTICLATDVDSGYGMKPSNVSHVIREHVNYRFELQVDRMDFFDFMCRPYEGVNKVMTDMNENVLIFYTNFF